LAASHIDPFFEDHIDLLTEFDPCIIIAGPTTPNSIINTMITSYQILLANWFTNPGISQNKFNSTMAN